MPQKLFIGGLPFSMTTERLRELFAQVEGVESVAVITDQFSGQSRGFGFVEMATPDAARSAIQKFDGMDIDGRRLKVEMAKAPGVGSRSGGGSDYRGGGRGRW